MKNVIDFPGVTVGRISPDKILAGISQDQTISDLIAITLSEDGFLSFYSSTGSKERILFLLEKMKQETLKEQEL